MSKTNAGLGYLLLRLRERKVSKAQVDAAEKRLLMRIGLIGPRGDVIAMGRGRKWWLAAASVVLLLVGAYGVRLAVVRPSVAAQFGEIKDRVLPDGSEVTVNADSRVTYSRGWTDGKDREVWLKGEAFFHVAKTPMKSRFIVHTDHFDIIVTGTRFNAVNRPGEANVLLKEGSVTLYTGKGKDLNMKPGDFVAFRGIGSTDEPLEKKAVKTDSVLAWKEHKLLFNNTPLREVVEIIKQHYGVEILLADPSVGERTVFGIMANDNLDVLLQALQATSDFEVVRNGAVIVIRNHQ